MHLINVSLWVALRTQCFKLGSYRSYSRLSVFAWGLVANFTKSKTLQALSMAIVMIGAFIFHRYMPSRRGPGASLVFASASAAPSQTSTPEIPSAPATAPSTAPPSNKRFPTLQDQMESHRRIYKEDKEWAAAHQLSELYRRNHKLDASSFIEPDEVRWVNEQLAAEGMSYKFLPPQYEPPAMDSTCKTFSEALHNKITYAPGVTGITAISIPASDCNKANGNEINNPSRVRPLISLLFAQLCP